MEDCLGDIGEMWCGAKIGFVGVVYFCDVESSTVIKK